MTVPTYLPYYVLIGTSAIIVALILGLRAALANAGWQEQERAAA